MGNKLLDGLNAPQRDAVLTESGPMLVLAGAGTGKTRVVTIRIAHLISKRIRPERILAVTFTNKAAKEMQERVGALLPHKSKQVPEISTFHSLCVRVLRRNIEQLGYPKKFTIYARGQQESLARKVLRECKVPNTALKPSELLYRIGNWKNRAINPQNAVAIAESDKDHLAAMGYRRYQKDIALRGAVDFDDLLLLTEKLFAEFPEVRDAEAGRFDHVMVDEYQDTNGCQYRIVSGLTEGHRNLCVVGDDDQSIYGWRGAEVEHILRFSKDWPDAKVIRLEANYRSTDAIIEHSNRLIAFNKTRHGKTLIAARPNGERPSIYQFDNEEEEAKEVVSMIRRAKDSKGFEPRDFAILFRTNEQPRAFEAELRRQQIPYVLIGGMSFFDRREVRDTLAYLQLLDNPREETSLLRVLNNPPRGIGAKTIETLMKAAVSEGNSVWDVMTGKNLPIKGDSAAAVTRFTKMINRFRGTLKDSDPMTVLGELLKHIGYRNDLSRLYPETNQQEQRWASVSEVFNALGAYMSRKGKKASIGEFLHEVAVNGLDDKDEKEKQLRRNAVVLMTLHAAKGLEFPNVFMVGMEEGLLPHRRSLDDGLESAIEEERRLCYVGMTRAEDTLTFSLALTRRKWGKVRPTDPSRFLFEIIGKADGGGSNRTDSGASKRPNRKIAAKKAPRKKAARKKSPRSKATTKRAKKTEKTTATKRQRR